MCLQGLHNWNEVRLLETTAIQVTQTTLPVLVFVRGADAHDCIRCNESGTKVTMAHLFTRVEIRHFPEAGKRGRNHSKHMLD